MAEKHPHVARANAYARGVVSGKVLACQWVKLACQRHLDDLKRSKTKAFPYRFDAARAQRSCSFAELLPHVKGHWAIPNPRKPDAIRIRLNDWQCFIRCSIRGWLEKGTGLRRFQTSYVEVPRKNGKSVEAASQGLESVAADGEYGAEVYCGATTEDQAWEVFRPARLMAERTPAFLEHYGVVVNASNIAVPKDGSRFEPIIGNPGDGASPSWAIVDEYHEHPDSSQYDTMVTGQGARLQPMMFVITTAGDNIAGPCYALRSRVQSILNKTLVDERTFGIIYTIDEGDDWTKEEALRKANPNFDVSVSGDFLRKQQRVAIESAREQGVFKTKHLNIWVASRAAWMNMEWWHRQKDEGLKAEQFAGQSCVAANDLASKIDLAASVKVFSRLVNGEEHYYVFGRYYVPEKTVLEPTNNHYQGWAFDGHLIATDGDEIDQERIKADLIADAKTFQVREMAFDEWGAIKLAQELVALRLPVVRVPQTVKQLSDAMKWVEALTKAGRLHHDGNPVLAWMISNVTAKVDANDNVFPRKESPEKKIDGAVALIMAMARHMAQPIQQKSVYETRGVRTVG